MITESSDYQVNKYILTIFNHFKTTIFVQNLNFVERKNFFHFLELNKNVLIIMIIIFNPGEELFAEVSSIDGPESNLKISWMLLSRLEKVNAGKYYCIANNTVGETITSSIVSLL